MRSILPDIIDKPIGMILLRAQIANGRIFCHTLLFALLLLHSGIILSGQGRRLFLSLFIGVAFHLVLDMMWTNPHTLFWPLYGWSFAKETPIGLLEIVRAFLHTLLTNPALMGTEAIGGMVLLALILSLLYVSRFRRFIKWGDL
jgi:inner membrane protein